MPSTVDSTNHLFALADADAVVAVVAAALPLSAPP